jgi:hypothetical protein
MMHALPPRPPAITWTAPTIARTAQDDLGGILLEQTRTGPGRCPTWHLQRIGHHTLRFVRIDGCIYRAVVPVLDWVA